MRPGPGEFLDRLALSLAVRRGIAVGYKHSNPQNRAKAATLLRQLKGQLVDVTGVQVEARSNVYASAEAYLQLSKAVGVHLYQEGGGWHADLEFRGLPHGIPRIVGTPEPVPTRAEAIESVVEMMSICAQRDNVTPPDPATGLRWFRFDDHHVPVDPEMLEHFVSRIPHVAFDAAHIRKELDLLRADISGDAPVTDEAWSAAEFQLRYDACRMCCAAMAFGIMQVSYDPTADLDLAERPAAPGMH